MEILLQERPSLGRTLFSEPDQAAALFPRGREVSLVQDQRQKHELKRHPGLKCKLEKRCPREPEERFKMN